MRLRGFLLQAPRRHALAVLIVTIFATFHGFTAAHAQDTTGVGTMTGVVRTSTGTPSAGARVCVIDTALCTTTDDQGTFRIPELRPGAYRLEILPADGAPIVSEPVSVRAGLSAAVEVALPERSAIDQTITVTASAFEPPPEVKTSGFIFTPREVLKSAGALQDVSRYVQSLPGVVIGSNDFRNDIIVRGGSPLENLFVVDNVEIPNINTFANFASAGGTVSILDAEILEDVTFLTGGYPAPYVNRTSSVLQVTQREGNRERTAAQATLGFAGGGLVAEGPIGSGRGSWILSARRSFLDVFTDDIGIGGVPVLYTLNGKVVYDLSPSDRLWAVNISGVDRIRLGLREDQDLDDELANFDIRYQGSRTATGVNWQHVFGGRAVGLLGLTHSRAVVSQQVKDLVRDVVPPPDANPDDLIAASPVVYREESSERELTMKYDLTVNIPAAGRVQTGGSVKIFDLDYDAASPFGNDTPYSPVPGVAPVSIGTPERAYQHGAYVQVTRDLTSRINVTVGTRLDHYQILRQTRLSPRAGVKVQLTDALAWTASTGAYYQQPAFLFVTAFPENRSLEPWRANHYVTGLAWTPAPGRRVTVEAYRKTYRDYPVATEVPSVSLANIGDTFDVREILFRLASAGRGYADGVEIFAEQRMASRIYGQANLSISRSRHAGLDGQLRPGSFDYPVVFNLTGGYRATPQWEFSTRAVFLSGRPYTPFDAVTSSAQRRGVYDLTQINGLRAPAYVRIDIRVDRTFTAAGRPLNLFFGVQNLTARRNFAGASWNRRTNREQAGEQQGLFPILGLDWKF